MTCDKNPEKIKNMFDEIAGYYDKMNNFISFGLHYLIKIQCIKTLAIKPNSMILDLCCGTGDFTKIITKIQPNTKIIGLDNSKNMITLAKQKNPKDCFILADCTELPFSENEFDYITIGFGLRNIENRQKALQEIYRTLKPGAKFLHLDFGEHNKLSKIFDKITPFITDKLGKNKECYQYLIESKNTYPQPDELIDEFLKAGFKFVQRTDFLFGAISCQIMAK